MAKFFIELSTGIGPLIRCLPIMLWLRERGHEVRYFARDNSTQYMREFGFEPIDIDPPRVAFNRALAADWRDTDEFWGTFGFKQAEWLGDRIAIWSRALKAYAPDVVVGDLGVLTSIAARILDIPLAMITQSCFHPRVLGGIQTFWRDQPAPKHETRECVNRLLRAQGRSDRQVSRFDELFCGDRTIIPSIPELDALEPGPAYNEVYVGPILWDGVRQGADAGAWPELDPSRRVVFVYTGRMHDSAGNSGERLLRAVLDSAGAGAFNLVISTGGIDELPADIDLDRPNVRVIRWTPMREAYTRSDLIIHHGGHGSCIGGLVHAVPAVIVPTHNEREYNARLMQNLGCARLVPRSEATGERIAAAAVDLLEDRSARRNLERHSRAIAADYSEGVERAGQAILSLLQ